MRLRKNRGFTLIEVLIAIFVLSIGIFAVGKFQGSAIKGDFQADNRTKSCSIAANEAERFLEIPYDLNDLAASTHPPSTPREQFCVGWDITNDAPLRPITHDTNGVELTESEYIYTAKSIRVGVFKDYDDTKNFQDNLTKNGRFYLDTVRPSSF